MKVGQAYISIKSASRSVSRKFTISIIAAMLGISSTAWSLSAQQQALNTFISCVQFMTTQASTCPEPALAGKTCTTSGFGQMVGQPGTPTSYFSYSVSTTCRSPFGVETCGGSCPLGDSSIGVPPAGVANSSSTIGDTGVICPLVKKGSVINESQQSAGEEIPISGTDLYLSYQTLFDPDRIASREIRMTVTPDPGDPGYLKTFWVQGIYTPLTSIPFGSLDYLWTPSPSQNPFVDSDILQVSLTSTLSLTVMSDNGTLKTSDLTNTIGTTGASLTMNANGASVTSYITLTFPPFSGHKTVQIGGGIYGQTEES
ncbi:MAG: hypothetical protein C5B49_10535, partial [Bdellovibrio sp.]